MRNLLNLIFIMSLCFSCKNTEEKIPEEKIDTYQVLVEQPKYLKSPDGMQWIKGKTFIQGAKEGDEYAMPREKPAKKVTVDGFFIDITEVTNAEFKAFIEATNYLTVAERKIDWEEMKKELPPGTPKPADSILQPGSLIFNKNVSAEVNMQNYGQWWTWKVGANWQHPSGPESTIEGKDNFPVVHIALEDAQAYCKWAKRRLPTEAEWEAAAQGSQTNAIYTWGNTSEQILANTNTWQGTFPVENLPLDGFKYIAPVKSYPPNSVGIYDMLGNVWEITSDYFNINYYKDRSNNELINPKGAIESYNPNNPYQAEYVMKGGSFLCHVSYCASYRISARMGTTADSGSDHMGFRTVATVDMLNED